MAARSFRTRDSISEAFYCAPAGSHQVLFPRSLQIAISAIEPLFAECNHQPANCAVFLADPSGVQLALGCRRQGSKAPEPRGGPLTWLRSENFRRRIASDRRATCLPVESTLAPSSSRPGCWR